jgi:hypothetical protein
VDMVELEGRPRPSAEAEETDLDGQHSDRRTRSAVEDLTSIA